jgi:hypothetical protein
MFKKLFFVFASLTSLFSGSSAKSLRILPDAPQYNFILDAFLGDWLQIKSSHYVQITTEIDWFCTDINVSKQDNDTVSISVSPKIHAIYYQPNKIVTTYDVINESNSNIVFNASLPLLLRKTGPIINGQYDYTILTGYDNKTLFIWARDFNRYYRDYDDEATRLVLSWEYNTTYKQPISVYSNLCLI